MVLSDTSMENPSTVKGTRWFIADIDIVLVNRSPLSRTKEDKEFMV